MIGVALCKIKLTSLLGLQSCNYYKIMEVIRTNRSCIWSHVTRTSRETARCNYCNTELRCKQGTTTNLLRHVSVKHNIELGLNSKYLGNKNLKNGENSSASAVISNNGDVAINNEELSFNTIQSNQSKYNTSILKDIKPLIVGRDVHSATKRNKGRRNASSVWKYMIRTAQDIAVCRICKKRFRCNQGTSNILRHIRLKHRALDWEGEGLNNNDQITIVYEDALPDGLSMPSEQGSDSESVTILPREGKKSVNSGDYEIVIENPFDDDASSSREQAIDQKLEWKEINTSFDTSIDDRDKEDYNQYTYVRKNASSIWASVTKLASGFVRCNYCPMEFKANSGTSNVLKHLKLRHGIVPGFKSSSNHTTTNIYDDDHCVQSSSNLLSSQNLSTATTSVDSVQKHSFPVKSPMYGPESLKRNIIDKSLIKMIWKDVHSTSIVDNEGFKEFCEAFDPRYKLPSQALVEKMLHDEYSARKEELVHILNDVDGVALTLETWMSVDNVGYLTVTAHFLEPLPSWKLRSPVLSTRQIETECPVEKMTDIIIEILNDFKIKDKIIAAATDESNSQSMCSLVQDHLKVYHVKCLSHILDLIVQEAIEATPGLNTLVKTVTEVVNFFHENKEATERLQSIQAELSLDKLELLYDDTIKWNSKLHMLRRYCDLHEPVTKALQQFDAHQLLVPDIDVEEMRSSCASLEQFEEAIIDLSTQIHTPVSKVIVIVRGLQYFLQQIDSSLLNSNLSTALTNRFLTIEDSFTGSVATLLDPRFKRAPFLNLETRRMHEQEIVLQMFGDSLTQEEEKPVEETAPPPKKKSYMDSFRAKVNDIKEKSTQKMTGPHIELDRFMEMEYQDDQGDPLLWWKDHSNLFPSLSNIARKYIYIPATSILSKEKSLISARKRCLNPPTVDMMLFLNKHLD